MLIENFHIVSILLVSFHRGISKISLECRYVVRAKAGKKQSLKDASGRFAHSAGASLRRYNELSLKKVPLLHRTVGKLFAFYLG